MRRLFLIPARSGSKRLPGKNLALLGGKPLIQYSIEFAVKNKTTIDEICVSTDDDGVFNLCLEMNLTPPFKRPKEISGDKSTSSSFIKHALEFYQNQNIFFDLVILLQPTSPIRRDIDLENMTSMLISEPENQMIVSVGISKLNPYFNLFYAVGDNLNSFFPRKQRFQDCPESYFINGSIYIFKTKSFMESKNLNNLTKKKYIMDDFHSVDIDDESDLKYAEYLINQNAK